MEVTMTGRPHPRVVVRTVALVVAIHAMWIGGVVAQGVARQALGMGDDAGRRIRLLDRDEAPALDYARRYAHSPIRPESSRCAGSLPTGVAPALWGGGAGLVLGLLSLATKAVQHRPLLSVSLTWPFFSVVVISPIFEEFLFRGAVLGVLVQRYRFATANLLTAIRIPRNSPSRLVVPGPPLAESRVTRYRSFGHRAAGHALRLGDSQKPLARCRHPDARPEQPVQCRIAHFIGHADAAFRRFRRARRAINPAARNGISVAQTSDATPCGMATWPKLSTDMVRTNRMLL